LLGEVTVAMNLADFSSAAGGRNVKLTSSSLALGFD
jgi:hypothetical protein